MKSLKNSKRRVSRWKMINILNKDQEVTSYFPLDEFGRLVNRFQKSKPRNLNLLMNSRILLSTTNDYSIKPEVTSDPDKSSNNDLFLEDFDVTEEENQKNDSNFFSNLNSIDEPNSKTLLDNEFSDLLVSSSLIQDTQWCIDYVTSHLLI